MDELSQPLLPPALAVKQGGAKKKRQNERAMHESRKPNCESHLPEDDGWVFKNCLRH
jgi:hypothetical protein